MAILSCKNDEDKKLIYNELINYRDELKMSAKDKESYILIQKNESELIKKEVDKLNNILAEYEKSFEALKFKERLKIVQSRDSFNLKYKLFLKFDNSNYDKIHDTIFNRLMEIDFYRLKNRFQDRYLFRKGCK